MPSIPILLVIIIFMFGAFLKGWSGFGTNLIVPPLLILLGYDPKIAIVITVSVNLLLNASMLIESKKLDFKNLYPLLMLVIPAFVFHIVGLFLFQNVGKEVISVILGLMILFMAFNRIFKFKFKVKNPKKFYIPVGIISGLLNGMVALGGIPFLLLLASTETDKEKFKSTVVTYFLFLNILAIAGYVVTGRYTSYVFTNIGYVSIFAITICMFGVYLSRKVSPKKFNIIMNYILIFFGINMLSFGFAGKHIILYIYDLFVL
jgi:hypothetical protein